MSSDLFIVKTYNLPGSHIREYPNTLHPTAAEERPLQISAKQYIPKQSRAESSNGDTLTAVTIIAASALGFPRECYEPFFAALLLSTLQTSSPTFTIRSIWIADVTHEGASSILNSSVIGAQSNWFDHSRDLLHLINTYRTSFPRPIIGIGHSRGCSQLAQLSHIHPRLLSGLIFVEPLMLPGPPISPFHPSYFATKKRDIWPSRAAAEEDFKKNRAFKTWDGRVLRRYMDVAFRDLPTEIYADTDHEKENPSLSLPASSSASSKSPSHVKQSNTGPPVTLTTTKHQEAWAFIRPNMRPRPPPTAPGNDDTGGTLSLEDERTERLISPNLDPEGLAKYISVRPEATITSDNLPFLRPRVMFIFGAKSPFSPRAEIERKVRVTGTGVGGNGGARLGKATPDSLLLVEHKILPERGHFTMFEDPEESAGACVDYLSRWTVEWRQEEEFLQGVSKEMSEGGQGRKMSEDWIKMVEGSVTALRPVAGKEKL